jgi:hypothetical protein
VCSIIHQTRLTHLFLFMLFQQHNTFDEPLAEEEIIELKGMLEKKKMEVGDCSTVTEFKSGEKRIEDASLMFRGMVVVR